MKHLVICDYGAFLGLNSHRLAISQDNQTRYYPLNRLCTVTIAKCGVSVSSDLVEVFSNRGIKLFFLDFRGVARAVIHATWWRLSTEIRFFANTSRAVWSSSSSRWATVSISTGNYALLQLAIAHFREERLEAVKRFSLDVARRSGTCHVAPL